MALGGGTWVTQNKVLPGAYINVKTASTTSTVFGDRGTGAIPLILDWGTDGAVFEVTAEEFQKNSLTLFGYSYTHSKMKDMREFFKKALNGVFYKLNSDGVKASTTTTTTGAVLTITAKYKGSRGNDIKVIIAANVDDPTVFEVSTYFDGSKVETQKVKTVGELVENEFVTFSGTSTDVPNATAGVTLANGTTGTPTGTDWQLFLDKIESYDFSTLGCPSDNETIKSLFYDYTLRMRDTVGKKFQTVIYNKAADYEGVINLKNAVTDFGANAYSLVYWLTGAEASCEINKTLTNTAYNGEYSIDTDYTQSQLETALESGELVFHKVKYTINVLEDVNSFVTYTEEKKKILSDNQSIRVLDQIANDTAVMFNKYKLGKVQNEKAGRISFWKDLVAYNKDLETLRAIEGVVAADITVNQGETKKSVVVVNPVTIINSMTRLYMNIIAS